MKRTLLLACLLAPFICVNAQVTPQAFVKETNAVAFQALSTVREMAKAEHFSELGFDSAAEAASATLGEPLPVFMVTLEDLRRYEPGQPAENLLKPLEKVIYPVAANGQVKSSIVVEKTPEGWQPTNFGSPNLIKLLAETRRKMAGDSPGAAEGQFVVQAPALNAYFIGIHANGKLILASVIDDPGLKLTANQSVAAEDVFANLASAAKTHDDLPR